MIPEREDAMTTMTTYKKAIAKLAASNRPVIISNDDIILLKNAVGYSLVRNDGVNLIQTRFKTVHSLEELEDDWVKEDTPVEFEKFRYEEDASLMFSLMVIAATHRDIVL